MKKNRHAGFLLINGGLLFLIICFTRHFYFSSVKAHITLDLVPDTFGYILIFAGAAVLGKCSKLFKASGGFALAGAFVYTINVLNYASDAMNAFFMCALSVINCFMLLTYLRAVGLLAKRAEKPKLLSKSKMFFWLYLLVQLAGTLFNIVYMFGSESAFVAVGVVVFGGMNYATLVLIEILGFSAFGNLKKTVSELANENIFE